MSVRARKERPIRTTAIGLAIALVVTLSASVAAEPIRIMTFNVENLFDTKHDEGKNDETYLPLAAKQNDAHRGKCARISVERWRDQCLFWDWNERVLDRKLSVVADAIRQVDDGRGADIIAFQEVENVSLLERLRTGYLADLGYRPAVLLERKDRRGIDVAFLSRFEVRDPRHHEIEFSADVAARVGDTRPILEATFVLDDGSLLTGYAVHFPAPFHPTVMRESAYRKLNALLNALPAERNAFAAGDFNTTREEDGKKAMLERWVRPHWEVAHDLCGGCQGTSYYPPRDDWSFLDMVLWRSGGELRMAASYLANETDEQITDAGTPRRFELPEATGVSDHWPLVLEVTEEGKGRLILHALVRAATAFERPGGSPEARFGHQ